MSLLELRDISVTYNSKKSNPVKALQNIDLDIEEGEFVTITGKSGCGKTTLLNVIAGIRKPDSGEYIFDGEKISRCTDRKLASFRNKNVGFVVQHFALIPDITVRENVSLPLIYKCVPRKLTHRQVDKVLEMVDVISKKDDFPYELSGGQQQRVAIARAIIASPKMIIADEPTGALDEETGKMILEILKRLNQEGMTIVMVTHDLELAESGSRQIKMRDGKIIGQKNLLSIKS